MADIENDFNDRSIAAFPSRRARRAGLALSGIASILLAFDAVTKVFPNQQTIDGTLRLGYQMHHIQIIGALGLMCLILYVIPRTAPIGAIFYTGYLGGVIASNLRMDFPLFTFILVPVYVATFIWGGLYLRDDRIRALVRARRDKRFDRQEP